MSTADTVPPSVRLPRSWRATWRCCPSTRSCRRSTCSARARSRNRAQPTLWRGTRACRPSGQTHVPERDMVTPAAAGPCGRGSPAGPSSRRRPLKAFEGVSWGNGLCAMDCPICVLGILPSHAGLVRTASSQSCSGTICRGLKRRLVSDIKGPVPCLPAVWADLPSPRGQVELGVVVARASQPTLT